MKLSLVIGLIGFLIQTLSAQPPRITRIELRQPATNTPPFRTYENVNGRWYGNDSHDYPGPCFEVLLTFTTELNKHYWIECGSLPQPRATDNTPWVRLNQWTRVSLDITGTGTTVTWTNGVPYSCHLFRVGRL